MKFHTQFLPPAKPLTPCGGPSLTDQCYIGETDINTILKRYAQGDSSVVRPSSIFADVSALGDFSGLLELVRKAQNDFESLPSDLRARFGNDPAALVAFLEDSTNDDEAIRLGLKVVHTTPKSIAEQITDGVTAALKAAHPASFGDAVVPS